MKPEQINPSVLAKRELEAELARIEMLILLNEANENTIERTAKREELLELQDSILDDLDAHK